MPEFEGQRDQRRYLDAVLRLDPAEDGPELFARRRHYLELEHPPAFPPPYAHLPKRLECQARIEAIREHLDDLEPGAVRERIAEIEVTAYPDQRAWLDRLRRVSDARATLEELGPQLDPEFAAVLQTVLTAPMGESVAVKETFLHRLWARPDGQGFRRQVALLRKRAPLLAALEPEWLDQIALREGPAFGRQHLAWVLLAVVYGVLMLLKLLGGAS